VNLSSLIELVVLAALWGASFLLMRIAVPEFGAIPLIELRVVIAAAALAPFLRAGNGIAALGRHWKPIAVQGIAHAAVPFCLLAFATLHMTAGSVSIANASAPLFAALIAWLLLADNIGWQRLLGLATGFAGVVILLADNHGPGLDAGLLAAIASVTAAAMYGYAAVYSRKNLTGVNPVAVAAGSQFVAALLLLLPAVWLWPAGPISGRAWIAVIFLGVVCTGFAYSVYFRLITNVGPTRAITVAYLVPAFAVFWGAVFLNETVGGSMILGGAVILAGTVLATGLVRFEKSSAFADWLMVCSVRSGMRR
jgi:drug/metabolite transporter (DMT)-like permease